MQTIYMVGQCLKNCLQAVLNGKKDILKFNEVFIEDYDEDNDKGIFLKQTLNILNIYMACIGIYHSYLKE